MVRRSIIALGGFILIVAAVVWQMSRAERQHVTAVSMPAMTLAQHAPPPPQAPRTGPPKVSAEIALPEMSAAEAKIRLALSAPVSLDIDAEPLEEFADRIASMLKVGVALDAKALEELGYSQKQVKVHVAGVSGKAALELVLDQLELDWAVHHEVLWITTVESARTLLTTKVYPISDLTTDFSSDDPSPRGREPIVELVTASVVPTTWDEVGGTGSIHGYSVGGVDVLVISQTRSAHEKIAGLLQQLRAVMNAARDPVAPPPTVPHSNSSKSNSAPPARDNADSSGQTSRGTHVAGDLASIVAANNDFAGQLFHQVASQLAGDEPGNLLISPYGVWSCMGFVYRGAHGETAAEIAEALNLPGSAEHSLTEQAALRQRLNTATHGGLTLRIAERLWVQRGTGLEKPTGSADSDSFPLSEVDFAHPELASRAINQWASQATGGKIAELVQPAAFNADSRFIVASALYIDAPWQKPFLVAATAPAAFHTFDRAVQVPTMQSTSEYSYARVGDLQLLENPYAGGKFSMLIVLPPPSIERFRQLESELTAETLADWIAKLRVQTVLVRLPKFKITFDKNMQTALQELGVAQAFDPASADFSGRTTTGEPLFLSGVFQKTWIEVDEAGTTAAAATAIGGSLGASRRPQKFEANRPFLFLIRHRASGAVLFVGRVTDPKSA